MAAKIKYPIVNGKKECGDCSKFYPISEYNKARKHYVSRCKKCLRAYALKYRGLTGSKELFAKYHKRYMKDPENRKRVNKRNRTRNKREDVKLKRNKERREWTRKERIKAINYLGGECNVCGYNECIAAMDFHHKDPKEKEGFKTYWTFEKNKRELDKCTLLCCRCHRELHDKLKI